MYKISLNLRACSTIHYETIYIYIYIKWTVFVNVTTKSAQHACADDCYYCWKRVQMTWVWTFSTIIYILLLLHYYCTRMYTNWLPFLPRQCSRYYARLHTGRIHLLLTSQRYFYQPYPTTPCLAAICCHLLCEINVCSIKWPCIWIAAHRFAWIILFLFIGFCGFSCN